MDFACRSRRSRPVRWLTPDPLAGDVTNPQSLNRYAYVLDNPTSLIDPLGLQCQGGQANCPPPHPPTCTTMNCADQYYGGSMYLGFTSADLTTCTIDGVSANCNSAFADLLNGSGTLAPVGGGPWVPCAPGSRESEPGCLTNPLTDATFYPSDVAPQSLIDLSVGSWWGTFASDFAARVTSVGGLKTALNSLVSSNGCGNLLFTTFWGDLNPLPAGGLSANELAELAPKAAGEAGLARASLYSASKGLTVPLRSSVYRGLRGQALGWSEAVGKAAPYVLLGGATIHAVGAAGVAGHNGECH